MPRFPNCTCGLYVKFFLARIEKGAQLKRNAFERKHEEDLKLEVGADAVGRVERQAAESRLSRLHGLRAEIGLGKPDGVGRSAVFHELPQASTRPLDACQRLSFYLLRWSHDASNRRHCQCGIAFPCLVCYMYNS